MSHGPAAAFADAIATIYAAQPAVATADDVATAAVPPKDAAAIADDVCAVLRRRYSLEQRPTPPPPEGAPGTSVAELEELDVRVIDGALAALQAQVDSVDGELLQLRTAARAHDKEALPGLREAGASLDAIDGGMDSLVLSIGETAALAERLSARVQVIDLQRGRVAETMDRLDELMGLEQSSDVVSRAMETSDFESAVAHVQRLRDASERQDGAPVEPAMLAKMAAVQASLRQQVLRQLEEALGTSRAPGVADADAKAAELKVRRFCKLLAPLGEAARGAQAFRDYCCEQLRLIVYPSQPPAEPGSPSFQPAAPPPSSSLPVPAQLAQVPKEQSLTLTTQPSPQP